MSLHGNFQRYDYLRMASRSVGLICCSILLVFAQTEVDAVVFEHGFDTVGDMLFGWIGAADPSNLTDHQKTFLSSTYKIIVTHGAHFSARNSTPPDEWPVAIGARHLKELNPNLKILLYEATDFGPSDWGEEEIKAHPEWWLRDDNGKVYYRNISGHLRVQDVDWRRPDVQKWWIDQSFLFKPSTLDGLMVDSAGASTLHLDTVHYSMTFEHRKELAQAKMNMIGNATARWTAEGGIVVGNPLFEYDEIGSPGKEKEDDLFPLEYHWNYITGAFDGFFGDFGTLNHSHDDKGTFNVTKMAASIEGILNMSRKGYTVLVKGCPGPCDVPFQKISKEIGNTPTWPDNTQPKTAQGLKEASSRLVELALAPFLLVVEPNVWFGYSWFYGLNSGWVTCPSDPDSCTAPDNWYPEFDRPLGKPLGEAVRSGTVYTRQFEHASVYVDLKDRTASKITWNSA